MCLVVKPFWPLPKRRGIFSAEDVSALKAEKDLLGDEVAGLSNCVKSLNYMQVLTKGIKFLAF